MSQRRTRLGRIAASAVKGATALAVGVGLTVAAGAGVAHASTAPDPLKNWSVAHIEATSIANVEAASSLTISGSYTKSGKVTQLSIGIKKGVGCTATIVQSGLGTEKLLVIGKTVYMDLNKQFWTSVDGSAGAAIYAKIDGRYLKLTSASLIKTEAAVCTVQGQLATSTKVKVTRGPVTTLDGVRVLELKNSDGSAVYVTDSSKPELFAATLPKGSADGVGTIRLNVGAKVTVAALPAKDVTSGAPYGF